MPEDYKNMSGMEQMDRDWMFTMFSKYKCGMIVGTRFKTNSWKILFMQQEENLWIHLLSNVVDSTTLHGVSGRLEKDLEELPLWFPKQTKPGLSLSLSPERCSMPGLGLPQCPLAAKLLAEAAGWGLAARNCYHPPTGPLVPWLVCHGGTMTIGSKNCLN